MRSDDDDHKMLSRVSSRDKLPVDSPAAAATALVHGSSKDGSHNEEDDKGREEDDDRDTKQRAPRILPVVRDDKLARVQRRSSVASPVASSVPSTDETGHSRAGRKSASIANDAEPELRSPLAASTQVASSDQEDEGTVEPSVPGSANVEAPKVVAGGKGKGRRDGDGDSGRDGRDVRKGVAVSIGVPVGKTSKGGEPSDVVTHVRARNRRLSTGSEEEDELGTERSPSAMVAEREGTREKRASHNQPANGIDAGSNAGAAAGGSRSKASLKKSARRRPGSNGDVTAHIDEEGSTAIADASDTDEVGKGRRGRKASVEGRDRSMSIDSSFDSPRPSRSPVSSTSLGPTERRRGKTPSSSASKSRKGLVSGPEEGGREEGEDIDEDEQHQEDQEGKGGGDRRRSSSPPWQSIKSGKAKTKAKDKVKGKGKDEPRAGDIGSAIDDGDAVLKRNDKKKQKQKQKQKLKKKKTRRMSVDSLDENDFAQGDAKLMPDVDGKGVELRKLLSTKKNKRKEREASLSPMDVDGSAERSCYDRCDDAVAVTTKATLQRKNKKSMSPGGVRSNGGNAIDGDDDFDTFVPAKKKRKRRVDDTDDAGSVPRGPHLPNGLSGISSGGGRKIAGDDAETEDVMQDTVSKRKGVRSGLEPKKEKEKEKQAEVELTAEEVQAMKDLRKYLREKHVK